MPTPDASQFTQFKKYGAIDSRMQTNGVKQITHLSPFVPSVSNLTDFLASFSNKVVTPCTFIPINSPLGNANGKKGQLSPPTIEDITSTLISGGEAADVRWKETGAYSRSVTCIEIATGDSVPSAISDVINGACVITNILATPGPYLVTVTVTNPAGSASESVAVPIPSA